MRVGLRAQLTVEVVWSSGGMDCVEGGSMNGQGREGMQVEEGAGAMMRTRQVCKDGLARDMTYLHPLWMPS